MNNIIFHIRNVLLIQFFIFLSFFIYLYIARNEHYNFFLYFFGGIGSFFCEYIDLLRYKINSVLWELLIITFIVTIAFFKKQNNITVFFFYFFYIIVWGIPGFFFWEVLGFIGSGR